MKKLHIELESLGFELLYHEAMGNTERIEEIKHRIKEIERTLDSFYADPVTQARRREPPYPAWSRPTRPDDGRAERRTS